MTFNSPEFLIFLAVVFFTYWVLNLKYQNLFLVLASYIFYGWWDWRFLALMFISASVDYLAGLFLEKTDNEKKRKYILSSALTANLVILGFFKYYNFFVSSFQNGLGTLGIPMQSLTTLSIILPVGISFYTFQSMSYSIDVFRRTVRPTRDFVAFTAYVSFFPQLVAGPIERASNLLPQFQARRRFDYAVAAEGLRQMLWGFFKKIVIADNLGMVVEKIYGNVYGASSWELLVATFFFAFQIYCDFSGYSDIATGTARLFGFRLMRNFAYPYFSTNIIQFWKRWHISLSTWFRDYVYIPMGGSKVNLWKYARNVLTVFIVSGIWHGANWTFVAWGAIHGAYFLPLAVSKNSNRYKEAREDMPSLKNLHRIIFTFFLVLFAWVFFRAKNIGEAVYILGKIISTGFLAFPGFSALYPKRLVIIGILIFAEWISRNKQHPLIGLERLPKIFRFGLYYAIIFAIFFFGNFGSLPFIYFQF